MWVAPFAFVCKSPRSAVHGRPVNTPRRIDCGIFTTGKTFALKYCLSSSSMSALGRRDNICSPRVPKTWQPSAHATHKRTKRAITRLLSSSQLHSPLSLSCLSLSLSFPLFNSRTETDGRKLQWRRCLKSTTPSHPPSPKPRH